MNLGFLIFKHHKQYRNLSNALVGIFGRPSLIHGTCKLAFLTLLFVFHTTRADSQDFSHFLTRLSPNEGLSQSEVTKTVQDQQGFIWIATQMGLNRYDGYSIKHIKGPNSIFQKESIETLHLDPQGYLWVSTMYSGLYRVNTTTFETEQFFSGKFHQDDSHYAEVTSIYQSAPTTLWLGIENTVQELDIATRQLTPFFTFDSSDDFIRALYQYENLLFIATSNGLFYVDTLTKVSSELPHTPKALANIDSNNIKMLILDEQLGLLVGTVEGLYHIPHAQLLYLASNPPVTDLSKNRSLQQISPVQLISDLNIWDMEKIGNYYLVATNKGLFKYFPESNEIKFILNFSNSKYRISDDNILDLFRDKSGNIWLASRSQGVLTWSQISTRFSHITMESKPNLSNENAWKLYQDDAGTLWIGSNNGLNRYNLEQNQIDHFLIRKDIKSISGNHVVIDIFPDSQNTNKLWIHNSIGLFQFDKQTGELTPPYMTDSAKTLLEGQLMYGFYVVNNENIFFFSDISHYHYNTTTGEVAPLNVLNKTLNPSLSWSFLKPLPNQPNTILLGTSGHLYQYNLQSHAMTLLYKVKNYLPAAYDSVDGWQIDKQGVLWLAVTGEGLIGLDSNSFEERYRFNTSHLLATNHVHKPQIDEFDNIWVSSQFGLYRLTADRKHMEAYMAEDGLLSSEFNGTSSTILDDGRMVFGSPLGITFLKPEQFQTAPKAPKHYRVSLSNIALLSDASINFNNADVIHLTHEQYGLKIEYSTLDYQQQNRTKYDINLSGPSAITLTNYPLNEFLLPKLQPGKYELSITAHSPSFGTKSQPLLLSIIVSNAPWNSTSAKVAYLLILGWGLLVIFILRRRKQHEVMELHNKTQASRDRMQMALYGSNSGIWDYHLERNMLFGERIPKELGLSGNTDEVPMSSLGDRVKPEQFEYLKKLWHEFLNGQMENWDVTYQLKTQKNEWQWYRVVGRVIETNKLGNPTRVMGTYTNITLTKASEDKAKLFGEAFSQINDWVLILDATFMPVTANDAFLQVFNLNPNDSPDMLHQLFDRLGEQKYREFREILKNLKPRKSWQGEETIDTPNNTKHPVLVKINAISRQPGVISHYVIVISDITNQKHAEEKLRHLAHYDYLTDLPNRKLLFEKIEHKIKRSSAPFAVLFIDLDKFKQVNDLYGHFVGDCLLKHVASLLLNCVNHNDIVARQSGDEFIVLISQIENINTASHVAQQILDSLSKTIVLEDLHVHITSSVGIAIFPDDSNKADELIQKADLAMIHAKKLGRGEFQFFTQDMNEETHVRMTLENDLKEACHKNEFINYYQPIINSTQEKMVGVELLMRWQNNNALVSPGVFIPIAEEIGLISQMTINAIDTALKDYRQWFSHDPDMYISINLSPIHILQEGLGESLMVLLEKHKLSPHALRLEITENTLLADLDIALRRLEELRRLGFKLLLDDFGTGYSSMGYLSKFSIDYIKIDRSFISNLDNKTNRSIVDSIVALAKNLGLPCIVEGVETAEQLEYVNGLGCDLIQGFYYSKPIPVADFPNLNIFEKKDNKTVTKINVK